jgi:Spy/CpxP family protein refolding chaperone
MAFPLLVPCARALPKSLLLDVPRQEQATSGYRRAREVSATVLVPVTISAARRPDHLAGCAEVIREAISAQAHTEKAYTMKPRTAVLALVGCVLAGSSLADSSPISYAGQQTRAIKALSEEDITALLKGEGMGMAKAAELNGYPGPKHVLMLAEELKLTGAQRQQLQVIFDRMSAAARPLGAEVIGRELLLDRLFAEGEMTPDRLAAETAAIGTLEGSLRSVHLAAHLQTRALLSADQIALYKRLRGYESPTAPMHQHRG